MISTGPADAEIEIDFDLDMTSALTSNSQGKVLWLELVSLVWLVTGKMVVAKQPYPAPYRQTPDLIAIPHGDVEALTHELCHWAVATPEERLLDDLGLGAMKKPFIREQEAWDLEVRLFAPIVSEANLHATLTPMSQRDHNHFWHPDRQNGWHAASQLPVVAVRDILHAWWQWRVANGVAS